MTPIFRGPFSWRILWGYFNPHFYLRIFKYHFDGLLSPVIFEADIIAAPGRQAGSHLTGIFRSFPFSEKSERTTAWYIGTWYMVQSRMVHYTPPKGGGVYCTNVPCWYIPWYIVPIVYQVAVLGIFCSLRNRQIFPVRCSRPHMLGPANLFDNIKSPLR